MPLKRFITIVSAFLSIMVLPVLINAQERFIKITLNDDNSVNYTINNDLSWELKDGSIHIQQASFPESDIFLIEDVSSISYHIAIPTSQSTICDNEPKFYLSKDGFSINTTVGGHLTLYSMDGTILMDKYINGHSFHDLSSLPSGIYLAKFNEYPILKFYHR